MTTIIIMAVNYDDVVVGHDYYSKESHLVTATELTVTVISIVI